MTKLNFEFSISNKPKTTFLISRWTEFLSIWVWIFCQKETNSVQTALWSWWYSHHDYQDKHKNIGQFTSCTYRRRKGEKVERKINELKWKRSGVHKCGKEAKVYQRCQIGFKRFAFNLNEGGLLGIEVMWKTVNTFTFLFETKMFLGSGGISFHWFRTVKCIALFRYKIVLVGTRFRSACLLLTHVRSLFRCF